MTRAPVWSVALVLAAASGGAAAADPLFGVESYDTGPSAVPVQAPVHRAAWYEFGLVRSEFTATTIGPTGSTQPITANTVRFGIGFKVAPHIYFGGDADFGTISDSSSSTAINGRSTVMQGAYSGDTNGTTGAARVFGGVSAGTPALFAGAELALGARIETTSGFSPMGTQAQQDALVEGRGRLGLRLSKSITLAGIAAVDLRDHRDVSLGLALDFHLYALHR